MKQPEVGKEILYLTQRDVLDIGITRPELREIVRSALIEHGKKKCEMPAKIGIHPVKDSIMHAMPAWIANQKTCGIKWAESFPDNPKIFGMPATSGLIVLNCVESGWPLCVLDAIWVTARRTPMVTALAAEALAPEQTEVLGIVGAGVQGREHALAVPDVLPKLKKVKVFDRYPEATRKLISEVQPQVPSVEFVEAKGLEETVRGSQVVVTCSVIVLKPNPPIRDSWIEPGAFIAPVDFDTMWEWKTFNRADKFLVDSLEEMNYFMSVGYLEHGLPPLHAEIGEVVAGLKPGRQRQDELIIDMNIGMGIEDVCVANELFQRAIRQDVGTLLPL